MRRNLTLAVLGLSLSLPAAALARQEIGTPAPKQEATKRANIYNEQADATEQIAQALAEAKRNNTRVLIQWGGNWCGWCHLLHETMKKDADLRKTLLYEYEVVLIDIGRFDKNLDLADKYYANFQKEGVPYLTILDADGRVLMNHETGTLEAGEDADRSHDAKKIVQLLTMHQASPKDAMSLYEAALAEAREQDKRVFMHFGAPWCGWCHRLEDWMAREDVDAILSKNYIDLKIDLDRTAGESGKDLLAKYRQGGGGIPWFVILDETGRALIDSNGPKGNIGYPTAEEPEGIAHLMTMLRQTGPRLTDAQIAHLKATLEGDPEPKSAGDG